MASEIPSIGMQMWLKDAETQALMAALNADGAVARFVGGCVRNALMGEPVTDVDIATTDAPDVTARKIEAAGFKMVPLGVDHGTVMAVGAAGRTYEVTTLRVDVETDGRGAEVAFTGDWQGDAERRDFTMNALYADADGTVHDPLGGYDDLKARKVRFIGDAATRIAEDYLRILRFFREFFVKVATGTNYGGGPIESLVRMGAQINLIVPLEETAAVLWMKAVDSVLTGMMYAVSFLLPDFGTFLGRVDYVAEGYSLPGDAVARDMTVCIVYVLGAVVAGYFFFRSREAAK